MRNRKNSLCRHLVGYLVLPDHFGVVLLVGHDRVEHVANVRRREVEQVVVVGGGYVLFGGYDVGAEEFVEVLARLIAGVLALRLVLDRDGRFVLDLRRCAVHETVEHIVMRLLMLEYLFEKAFELGVFRLRGIKVVLLYAQLLLRFELGYELHFLLVKLHFRDVLRAGLPRRSVAQCSCFISSPKMIIARYRAFIRVCGRFLFEEQICLLAQSQIEHL